jgi:hypothetical protein
LVLYEDEEAGDTHMAIYIRAKGPGIDLDLFRWKNGGNTVDEVNAYGLGNASDPQEVTVMMTGPTAVIVEGYADDDQDWPSAGGRGPDLQRGDHRASHDGLPRVEASNVLRSSRFISASSTA